LIGLIKASIHLKKLKNSDINTSLITFDKINQQVLKFYLLEEDLNYQEEKYYFLKCSKDKYKELIKNLNELYEQNDFIDHKSEIIEILSRLIDLCDYGGFHDFFKVNKNIRLTHQLIDNFEEKYPELVTLIKEKNYEKLRIEFCTFLIQLLKLNFTKPIVSDGLRGTGVYFDFNKYIQAENPELENLMNELKLQSFFDLGFKKGFLIQYFEISEYFVPEYSYYIEPEALLIFLYEFRDNGDSETRLKVDWLEHDTTKFLEANFYDDYLNNPLFEEKLKLYGIPFDKNKVIALKEAHSKNRKKGLFDRVREHFSARKKD
jgi:hypothetical protein